MTAVIGIAMKTPRIPYRVPKARMANKPTSALTPTVRFMMRGIRTLLSMSWRSTANPITKITGCGPGGRATRTAGTMARIGPINGTTSSRPARTASARTFGSPIGA
jgi:hypothetical protein